MKNIYGLPILVFIFVLGMSCNPTFYVPNTQNVPMIGEKGQVNLSLAGNANQVEIQGAYGLSSKFALQANTAFYIPRDLDNGNGGGGKLFELGLGYYRPIRERIIFETYALFGIGGMENHFPTTLAANPNTTGKISALLNRYTIQPILGFNEKYYSVIFSSRFSSLNYGNYKGSLVFDNADQTEYLKANRINFLIEPALTVRVGSEKIKFQLQVMHSFNLSNDLFKQEDDLISMGLNFHF